MKSSFILAALAAVIAAVPAQAQPVAADLLPAYEVTTIVTSMGMRPIGRPAWMRGRYVVAAIDRYGRSVNIVLDARDGQVLAVQPIGRDRFGAPPPPPGYGGGYGRGPAPYDPMDGSAPSPQGRPGGLGGPGGPGGPPDDEDFYDNDQQQGAMPPPRVTAHPAPMPRDPSSTGGVTRNLPPEAVKDQAARAGAPVPRPRPALARANDPSNIAKPADKPAAAANADAANPDAAKSDAAKSDAAKSDAKPDAKKPDAKQAATPQPSKAEQPKAQATAKPEAGKPEAGKREIRVIDMSKPKEAAKPDEKPGEVIRF